MTLIVWRWRWFTKIYHLSFKAIPSRLQRQTVCCRHLHSQTRQWVQNITWVTKPIISSEMEKSINSFGRWQTATTSFGKKTTYIHSSVNSKSKIMSGTPKKIDIRQYKISPWKGDVRTKNWTSSRKGHLKFGITRTHYCKFLGSAAPDCAVLRSSILTLQPSLRCGTAGWMVIVLFNPALSVLRLSTDVKERRAPFTFGNAADLQFSVV